MGEASQALQKIARRTGVVFAGNSNFNVFLVPSKAIEALIDKSPNRFGGTHVVQVICSLSSISTKDF